MQMLPFDSSSLAGAARRRRRSYDRRVRRLLALALLVACAASACKKKGPKTGSVKDLVTNAFGFEGEVEMEERFGSGAPTTSSYTMKGQKVRVETPSGALLADLGAKKMYLLNDSARTYSVVDFGPTTTVDAGATPPRTKTGKKDVILGYACDEYTQTNPGGDRIEACITTAIYGPFGAAAGALGVLGDEGGFALRSVGRDAMGTEIYRSEVTRIDKRSIPESNVTVPPGYKETP
jgi:hypothetical protein